MEKYLIINGDDFGLSVGINRGILECHKYGTLTSASLMVNGFAFAHAVALAKENVSLDVGLHLNITTGYSILPHNDLPFLTNSLGTFKHSIRSFLLQNINVKLIKEIKMEFEAQIKKFFNSGLKIYFIDSHHHVHILPYIFPLVLDLCQKYDIPAIRIPLEPLSFRFLNIKRLLPQLVLYYYSKRAKKSCFQRGIYVTDHFWGISQEGYLNYKKFMTLICSLKKGVTEIMVHPGYPDEDLSKTKLWLQKQRKQDISILTDNKIQKTIQDNNITLTTYRDIVNSKLT